jgi:Tol biopolymer transport system component
LLPALVLVVLLAFPVASQAMLSYVRNPLHPTVFVANDDGSEPRKVGAGSYPHVAPNPAGPAVAYLHEGASHAQELKLSVIPGEFTIARDSTLMVGFREPSQLAWSPDMSTIAALKGPELGRRKLVLIDVLTGAQRVVARGFFSGFSFSPDSSELVYAKAEKEKYPPRSDVFRLQFVPPGAVSVAAEKPVRLTHDHNSSQPLWGPQKIVFVKALEGNKRQYGGKNELFLMSPQGKGVKRLTHTKVDPLLQGLFPTDWSADGSRLLAEFEGQDVSYAVVVNPKTGAQRPVAGTGESGFVGTDLSEDGQLVLGFNGGFDPGLKNHEVQTVPYSGGQPKTLVTEAFEPSWSR